MQLSAKLTNGLLVFHRYRLKRLLGRGGMGVVWLAHDTELEKDIALKFLSEHLLYDSTAIRDLKKETRRGMELAHPNIIRVYGFFSGEQSAAVAMEYVEGNNLSSLRDARENHCFEVSEIAPWTLELCSALHYAHTHAEIAHRDLKPANLMIDHKNRLKVADFGISASISEAHTRLTGMSGVRGTMLYMSPQQMLGQRPCASHDIYGLGATLFDLLTGKPVFHSGDISLQVRDVTPPSVQERREELGISGEPIPEEWEETIAACLAKDASKRPRNAAEVISRLCLYENGFSGDSSIPFPELTDEPSVGPSSALTEQSSERPPLTLLQPSKEPEAAPGSGLASVTVREAATDSTSNPPTMSGQTSLSPLMLALLVFCSVAGGGAVAFFAFQHGSNAAKADVVTADSSSIENSPASTEDTGVAEAGPDANWSTSRPDAESRRAGETRLPPPPELEPGDPGYGPPRRGERGHAPPRGGKTSPDIGTRAPAEVLAQPKTGHDFALTDIDMIFRWAPPVEFDIGSPRHASSSDTQVTSVDFTQGFWLSEHETTQAEYQQLMGENPSVVKAPENPVENITWFDAMEYCQRLNEKYAEVLPEGYVFTLPTQAQFEYASLGAVYGYYGRNGPHEYGWSVLNNAEQPQAVGQLKQNEFMLYDTVGNVAEWCRDWYAPLPGGTVTDFAGPAEGEEKVVKGGSYEDGQDGLRAFVRTAMEPNSASGDVGFRVALAPVAGQD